MSKKCGCRICRPDSVPLDPQEQRAVDVVRCHGWQVVVVSDDVDCPCCAAEGIDPADRPPSTGPAFAYTVGLTHQVGHPELVISGLAPDAMHAALNVVAAEVVGGRTLRAGDLVEDAVPHVPLAAEQLSAAGLARTVVWSTWFHRRTPEALALVWPTRHGVFPWQPGAPALLDERQPPAWRLASSRGGALALDPSWPFALGPHELVLGCSHVVERGAAVLRVVRCEVEEGERDEWCFFCGIDHHSETQMRGTHLSHLLRAAPSLREVADLAPGSCASRTTTTNPWTVRPLG